MSIGSTLRQYRKAKKLTQTQLAEALGRKQQEVHYWETEQVRIPAEELPDIARILGCTIENLFTDTEAPTHA